MVGGRRRGLSCFFTLSAVLLFGVCLLDVEASTCPSSSSIIHKNVGETVKLSSCLPTEGVTLARWIHRNTTVADKNRGVTKDRFYLNHTDFSLTVKTLTLQDSGNFSFISEVNDKQRPTVVITLQVHEPITKEPDVTVNSTWDDSNKSCTVLLECSSTSDRSVTYSWSVKNQTQSGSRLKVNVRPEDGETTVTCTISDHVSEKSASKPVKCSNNTDSVPPGDDNFILVLGAAAGGCLLIVVIVGIIVGVCQCKQKSSGSDSNDLTVYADVAEIESGTSNMKPCSVYETIDNRVQPVTPVKPGPQTVYDKIQFSRVRKTSSPYQDI